MWKENERLCVTVTEERDDIHECRVGGMDPGITPPTFDACELWLAILSYAFMYLGLPLSASESVSLLFARTRNTFLSPPVRTPRLPPHMFTLLTLSGPFSFNVTSYSKLSLPFQYLV